MSATFWKVFELTISVLENMLLLGFCMDFMQQRPKGKRGKFLSKKSTSIVSHFEKTRVHKDFTD